MDTPDRKHSADRPISTEPGDGADGKSKKKFGLFKRKTPSSSSIGVPQGRASTAVNHAQMPPGRASVNPEMTEGAVTYRIILHHGTVTAADSNGLSDPFVKMKLGSDSSKQSQFQSQVVPKTLHPIWAEEAVLTCAENDESLELRVFDKDLIGSDDYLGGAIIPLHQLKCDTPIKHTVQLEMLQKSKKLKEQLEYNNQNIGNIHLVIHRLESSDHENEKKPRRGSKLGGEKKDKKDKKDKKPKVFRGKLIRVAVISARDIAPKRVPGGADAFCFMELGRSGKRTERKSRTIKNSLNPEWRQEFEYHTRDSFAVISFTIYDRNTKPGSMLGRTMLDTFSHPQDETIEHVLPLSVDDPCEDGFLRIAVTIQQLYADDDDDSGENEVNAKIPGFFRIHVIKARNLRATDLKLTGANKSDPFCMVEVNNSRKRTVAIAKTLNPLWDKEMAFRVHDIFGDAIIKVFDEDGDGKMDFLGQVIVPLCRINNGETEWWALKSEDGLFRSKGEIQMTMEFEVQNMQEAVKHMLLTPSEKFVGEHEKLKLGKVIKKLKASIGRLTNIFLIILSVPLAMKKALDWEYGLWWTLIIMAVYGYMALNFELWMLPMLLLFGMGFTYNFHNNSSEEAIRKQLEHVDDDLDSSDDDDDEGNAVSEKPQKKKKDKRGLIAKLKAYGQLAQDTTDTIASVLERIKNALNWTVPLLTELVVVLLLLVSVILYLLPLKWCAFAGGEALFLLNGKAVLLNAIRGRPKAKRRASGGKKEQPLPLDILARVPSDRDLQVQKRLQPTTVTKAEMARRSSVILEDQF